MAKCYYCDREILWDPQKCDYCGQTFCTDHGEPMEHECEAMEAKEKVHQPLGLSMASRTPPEENKGDLSSMMSRFMQKIGGRHYGYWIRYTLLNIAFLIVYGILALLLYENVHVLNELEIPVIRLGSVLLIIFTLLALDRIYFLLLAAKGIYNRMNPNVQVILVIALMVLTIHVYMNQNQYMPYEDVIDLEIEKFNPVSMSIREIKDLSYKLTGKGDGVTNKKTYEMELNIYKQVNEKRQQEGLPPLTWHPQLGAKSRDHSREMASIHALGHIGLPNKRAVSSEKTMPSMKDVTYPAKATENIGYVPIGPVEGYGRIKDTKEAATAITYIWMNQSASKANILHPQYKYIGVGVAYDSQGNYYVTQKYSK